MPAPRLIPAASKAGQQARGPEPSLYRQAGAAASESGRTGNRRRGLSVQVVPAAQLPVRVGSPALDRPAGPKRARVLRPRRDGGGGACSAARTTVVRIRNRAMRDRARGARKVFEWERGEERCPAVQALAGDLETQSDPLLRPSVA